MNGCLFSTKRYSGSVAIYVRVIIFKVEEIVPSEETITDYILRYFKLDFKSYHNTQLHTISIIETHR